ncbi:IGP family C-type lectin domain containing protein [Lotmaria passim]
MNLAVAAQWMCVTSPLRFLLFTFLLLTLGCHAQISATAASVYDVSEVQVLAKATPEAITYAAQSAVCSSYGGSLFADVSTEMHTKLTIYMNDAGSTTFLGYLGGSTTQSVNCPTTTSSLNCVWRWNSGRYGASFNATLPFYRGNYYPQGLAGAGPLNNLPSFWFTLNGVQLFPSSAYQQYLIMSQVTGEGAWWKDSSPANSYDVVTSTASLYALCVVQLSVMTGSPPVSIGNSSSFTSDSSDSSDAPTPKPTSTNQHDTGSSRRSPSGGAWAGIGVVIGVVVISLVCVLAWCNGWCCFRTAVGATVDAHTSARDENGDSRHYSPQSRHNSADSSRSLSSSSSSSPPGTLLLCNSSASVLDLQSHQVLTKTVLAAPSDAETFDSGDLLNSVPSAYALYVSPTVPTQPNMEASVTHSMPTVACDKQPQVDYPNPLSPPCVFAVAASAATADSRSPSPQSYPFTYNYVTSPELPAAEVVSTPQTRQTLTRTQRMPIIPKTRRLRRSSSSVSFVDIDETQEMM